ncbi:MAG: flippase [archaeon]|jgi:O-antigen/teichoic acid export membrane protein
MEAHEKKTIIKNLKWLTISKIIVYLLSIISITLIPRYLGVEGYGQLNFILSFVGLFSIIGDFGLTTLVLRDISKNPNKAKEYFDNLIVFKFILFFLFLLVVSVVSFVIDRNNPQALKLIIIFSLGVGFTLISGFILSFFDAIQQLKYRAVYEILSKAAYTFGVVLVILFNYKLFGIIIASAVSFLVGLIYVFINLHSKFKLQVTINPEYIKEKISVAYPFLLTAIFWTIYFSIDRVFLMYMKGNYEVGLYSIGYTFIGFLIGIVGILHSSFLPAISNFSENLNKQKTAIDKYLWLLYVLCVPITIGGIYLAPQIIKLVFGAIYLPGILAFQLTLFFFFFNSIGTVNYNVLISNGFEKFALKLLGLSAMINIIFNFILIPKYGIIGAAISTIIAELVVFVGCYNLIKNKIVSVDYLSPIICPLLASIFMLFGLIIGSKLFPNILLTKFGVLIFVVVGSIIYTSFLYFFKKEEITELIKLIRNK